MKSALPNYKLFPSKQPIWLYLFVLIAAFTLAGCGSQDETAPPQSSTLSFKISDTLLGSRLDQIAGTLTVRIRVGTGAFQNMDISADGLTASIPLNNLSLGLTDFTIEITFELPPFPPLVVALGTKTITVVAGSNPPIDFVTADFDTASFDEDGDGLSNLVELDEFSTTNPLVFEVVTIRSFAFSGQVLGVVGDPYGLTVGAGDQVTASLTYDANAFGTGDANLGFYQQTTNGGITATIGGVVFSSNQFTFIVENDRLGDGIDGFNATSNPAFNALNDLFLENMPVSGDIGISALDLTGSILSSGSLLALDPSSFGSVQIQLLFDDNNFLQVMGTLTLN